MNSFDVLTEPWIPVVDLSGSCREAGVWEVLESAHELHVITDPSPPIQFGLYRLLIALVCDTFELSEVEDVEDLLATGRLNPQVLARYIEQCSGCFDLFGSDRPFLQSAGMPREEVKTKSIAGLAQHLPSGTFATHFHHGLAGTHQFSPAVCARLLTTIAPFMTAGGAGLSPSINGIPPWYVLLEGANLFETLVLNSCAMDGPWSDRPGRPAWRNSSDVVPKKEVQRFSLVEGLTWRPRFVRLIPSEGGSCSYSGLDSPVLVRELIFEPGLRAVNDGGAWIDPQVAYRITAEGLSPLRPREGHVLWREIGPLTLLQQAQYAGDNGKVRFERPSVVSQFELLRRQGTVAANRPMRLSCFGMRTDGKMKVFEWQTERLVIHSDILAVPDAGRQVQQAMDQASWTSNLLQKALKAAYPRDGKSNDKAFDGLIAEARRRFWTGLRPLFEDEFLPKLASQDQMDPDAPLRLRQDWLKTLRRQGAQALEPTVEGLDTDADALRRQVRARNVYWREWGKLTAKSTTEATLSPDKEIES